MPSQIGISRRQQIWQIVAQSYTNPFVSTLQTGSLPVVLDVQLLVHVPAPPLAELQTAEVLLMMQHTSNTDLPQDDVLANTALEL